MAEPLPLYAVSICGVDDDGVSRILTTDASGNLVLAATIDTSNLALHADVDGVEALLTDIKAAVDGLEGYLDTVEAKLTALADPTTYTAVTPSDSTDVTSTTTKGLFVSVTGNVNITGVGGSAVSLGTQVAGTTIPGALSRVNAATTATVFGLSGP